MAILSTLLHVLLIIGKVLLILVLVILAILVLAVAVPYCYKVQVKADKEHFKAGGGVSWLLFVLRVRFLLEDDEKDFEVYFLGIPVIRILRFIKERKNGKGRRQKEPDPVLSGPASEEKKETAVKETVLPEKSIRQDQTSGTAEAVTQQEQTPGAEETAAQQEQTPGTAEAAAGDDAESVSKPPEQQEETAAEARRKQDAKEQKKEAKRQREAVREQKKAARTQKREMRKNAHRQKKAEKTGGRGSIFVKIRAVLEKVRWGFRLICTEMFKEALSVAKAGGIKVLKHVVPRRIRGFIRFGLNDPARTGQICGILAILYPKMPEKLEVLPDFQEACFEADTVLQGRIFLIYLIAQGVKIILNKNVRLLIKVVRRKVPLEKVIASENRRSGGNKDGK